MNTVYRRFGAGLLISALAALGFFVTAAIRARDTGDALVAAQQQRATLQGQVAKLGSQNRVRSIATDRETRSAEISGATTVQSPATESAESPTSRYYSLVASHPRLRELYLRKFEFDDGGVRLAALQLSEEQLQRIRRAALEREAGRLDLYAVAAAQGLRPEDSGFKKLGVELMREYQRTFAEALGPTNAAKYRAELAAPEPMQQVLADWIAARAAFDGTPLTLEQGRTLARILSEHTPADSVQPQGGYWHRAHRVDWDAALPKITAAGIPSGLVSTLQPLIEEKRLSDAVSKMIDAASQRFPAMEKSTRQALSSQVGYYSVPSLPLRKG